MAEGINGQAMLASGGHVWRWGDRRSGDKVVGTVGVTGAAALHLGDWERPLAIEGRDGGWALLKANGATRAAAVAAVDALVKAINALVQSGLSYTWEDDEGRTGSRLRIRQVRRGKLDVQGAAPNFTAWQQYRLDAVELDGGPASMT